MNKPIIKLENKTRVIQLENKNQFVIYNDDAIVFQSYRTLIAMWSYKEQKLYINWNYWDYSKTTSKHLKIFINEYTKYTYDNKNQFLKLLLSDDSILLFNE